MQTSRLGGLPQVDDEVADGAEAIPKIKCQ